MKKALMISISGKVQNVGFRYSTHKKATQLNICGSVKNQPDGSVFIEAEGEEELLNQFVLWCHHGPSWANVTKVNIQETPLMQPKSFKIK